MYRPLKLSIRRYLKITEAYVKLNLVMLNLLNTGFLAAMRPHIDGNGTNIFYAVSFVSTHLTLQHEILNH